MATSSTQIHFVINELIHNSRYSFEKSCIELLREIDREIIDSKELGHFEREGIDAYTFDVSINKYQNAYQFKGFEVMEFGDSQKKQCLKSINSFSKSDKHFNKYYLITNLPIKDASLRTEIENEIKLKIKTPSCLLLDSNQFVKMLLGKYNKIILQQIEKYNKRVVSQYQFIVDQKFYYPEVPYSIDKTSTNINPQKYILSKLHNDKTNEFNFSKWGIVISEFGFGKTSLVQNLISTFYSKDINCIYIPVSSLSAQGLSNTTNISKEIADMIFENKMDFENRLSHKLMLTVFKKAISSSNKMVLIFDGLDEHNFAYKYIGLKHIFSSFLDFTAPIIITMRKEFWEERREDIKLTIGKPDKNISILQLTEWNESNILEFLELNKISTDFPEKLNWFKQLLKSKEYAKHFGDIPKRPLFLKMLLKDLSDGNESTNSISKLYENYFIEKFKIDLNGYIGQISRPLSIKGGIVTQSKLITTILEKIAIKMISDHEKNPITLKEFIFEREIETILQENNIPDILEILMHSVLMPFGSKELSGFKLKFAHKSYQEYFTARYIFNEVILNDNPTFDKKLFYPQTIIDFIISMINDGKINDTDLKRKTDYEFISQLK